MAELRFGSFLAPRLRPLYEAVAAGVGRAVGMTVALVEETSLDAFAADAYDIALVCGLPYVLFERDGVAPALPVAAPVVSGERYRSRPVYFSDVIVRRDAAPRSLFELRGASWAYSERVSQSGYGIVRHHLLELGETGGFFGDLVASGSHEASIRMVLEGRADGAAIDSHFLDVFAVGEPELRQRLRVAEVLGPSPIQPVVVSRRLPDALRASIAVAIVGLHEDPTARPSLAAGLVERFVPVGRESYDPIRAMVAACEDAGFADVR